MTLETTNVPLTDFFSVTYRKLNRMYVQFCFKKDYFKVHSIVFSTGIIFLLKK